MSRFYRFDPKKAAANATKHGVEFADAISTFNDATGIDMYDEKHSKTEDRWFRIGLSQSGVVLVTVYVEYEEGSNSFIRIISSRRAKPDEVLQYLRMRGTT